MDFANLETKIKTLNKNDANDVLKVVSSQTIINVLEKRTKECPSYSCCPCDSKEPGTSCPCQCEDHCTCTKQKAVNIKMMEIYESLRKADDASLKNFVASLQEKIK